MTKTYDAPTFGPSGHERSFSEEGYTATLQMPKWLKAKGLELFEYSFGKGVRIGEDMANAIGEEAEKCGVEMSVHAPYYINFASVEDVKAENSITYLTASLKALRHFRGNRCVFHTGAQGAQTREDAFARAKDKLSEALEVMEQEGLSDLIICPETMGKQPQIGTVDEVAELCLLGKNVYPCIDFGHLNCLLQGALKTEEDYIRHVVDKLFDRLGEEKTRNMHVHFSKIQYGLKGEIRHLTFEDDVYGPEFEPLARVIDRYKLTPHILCESAGTQARDAIAMQEIYRSVARHA